MIPPTLTPQEQELFNAIHNAKAERRRTTDPERLSALHTRIGELTQKIRRLRMERGK